MMCIFHVPQQFCLEWMSMWSRRFSILIGISLVRCKASPLEFKLWRTFQAISSCQINGLWTILWKRRKSLFSPRLWVPILAQLWLYPSCEWYLKMIINPWKWDCFPEAILWLIYDWSHCPMIDLIFLITCVIREWKNWKWSTLGRVQTRSMCCSLMWNTILPCFSSSVTSSTFLWIGTRRTRTRSLAMLGILEPGARKGLELERYPELYFTSYSIQLNSIFNIQFNNVHYPTVGSAAQLRVQPNSEVCLAWGNIVYYHASWHQGTSQGSEGQVHHIRIQQGSQPCPVERYV